MSRSYKLISLPRITLHLLSMTLYLLPFIFLLYTILLHFFRQPAEMGPWLFALQFPLFGLVGYLLANRSGFIRSLLYFLSVTACMGLFAILFNGFNGAGWVVFGLGLILAVRSKALLASSANRLFQSYIAGTGIIGYFLLPFLGQLQPLLKPNIPLLNRVGIVALALFLFNISKEQVEGASQRQEQEGRVLPSLLWKTRIWTAVLFGLVIVVGFFRQIGNALEQALRGIGEYILYLLSLFEQETPEKSPVDSAPPPQMELPQGPIKDHPWLDLIFNIIAYALTGALVVFLLYVLFRKIKAFPRLLSRIKVYLGRLFGGIDQASESSYVDKKESLLELKEAPRLLLAKARNWLELRRKRAQRWSELADNKEKVRFLFRMVMRQAQDSGFQYLPVRTPIENSDELATRGKGPSRDLENLALQYNAVRYGDIVPKDAEVSELAEVFLKHKRG
ncbi:MAG: hypothetical protein H7X86_08705 [Gorillibacterium sp.]|nr:hypothetical protein [Gorillibacterium sp.]